jgi:hypothetical protein
MKKRALALVAVLALLGAAPAASQSATHLTPPVAVAAKSCSAGYVKANLSWGTECLRRGQFCKKSGDREYHRYGFHCHTGHLR